MLLEYTREFIVLASSLSFTEAARNLGLTQPTLSRHVAELEREVGCRLLYRSPVELTPEGASYLERVSPIVAEFDAVLGSMRGQTVRPRCRELSFAQVVGSGRAAQLYSAASAKLAMRTPSVAITPKEHATKSLFTMLRVGEIDCGFVYARPEGGDARGAEAAFLYSEPPLACMRKDNPLAERSPLHMRDLRECTLSFSSDKTYEDWAEGERRVCRIAGFEPRFSLKPNRHLIDFATSIRRNEVILADELLVSSSAFPKEVFVTRAFDDDPPIEYVCYLAFSPSADREAVDLLVDALREAARANGLNTDEALVRGEPA